MSSAGSLDPDRLATTEFSNSFRGYDTGEVRALLVAVSDAMRAASERERDLHERLAFAERELQELRESTAAEAEEAAETGRQQGREMVAEAQRVRERMLGDLARRRRHARQQVEQLMAGRERLLEAFEVVRQTIDGATEEMRASLPEARLAAEAAGRRFGGDVGDDADGDDDAVAALEEEIDAARLAGLPIIEEQAPTEAVPVSAADEPVPAGPDQRALPLVEPSADFEDVRIVPMATAPEPTETEEAPEPDESEAAVESRDEAVESLDEPEEAVEPEEPEEAVEPEEPEAAVEVEEPEAAVESRDEPEAAVESRDEPEASTDVGSAPEPGLDPDFGPAEEEIVPAPGLEAQPGSVVADPASLDDLFAGLRAARAEAVVEARSVLAEAPSAEAPESEPAASDGVGGLSEPAPPVEGLAPPDGASVAHAIDHQASLITAREALGSALKRVLADEQNEVLDRIRRLRKNQVPSVADVLGDRAVLAERLAATAVEPLGAVAATGTASMSHGRRSRPPAGRPMAAALGAEIANPLHERLRRGLGDAGADTREASELVRAAFRECKTQTIAALVADAASSAYHQGVLSGAGKKAALRWALDDADEACPDCADNALAGPVVRGDAFPTGHHHPPAHAGCRCGLELAPGPSS